MKRRRIGVVTVARSDFGIYRSLLKALAADDEIELRLYVSGAHLSPEFGETVREIEAAGWPIAARVPVLEGDDSPRGIAEAMARGIAGFSRVFAEAPPDLLVVLGDRYDMFAAALASVPFNIPLAHIHGGEVTAGAIDEGLRHSLTKLSHLHFVATEEYARRVRQLGEESWRVQVVGAPALDGLESYPLLSKAELEKRFVLDLSEPPLLVTFHPVTRQSDQVIAQTEELLTALDQSDLPIVFTAPNADTHGRMIREALERFLANHPSARLVENFGQPAYFSMLTQSHAMVGNSSSGIIEAASFGLPVINIGERQAGRTAGSNVTNAACNAAEITQAIRAVPAKSDRPAIYPNPYRPSTSDAATLILDSLKSISLDERLLLKRFADLPMP